MHDWPADPGEIPSPQLVAAWLTLDTLPTEQIPLWAAHWIAADYDGQTLAELAGLHGDDPHEVRDLLPAALAECGVSTPVNPSEERERAAAMVAFTAIARLQASGQASERWVVDKVVQFTQPYFKQSITGPPRPRGHYRLHPRRTASTGPRPAAPAPATGARWARTTPSPPPSLSPRRARPPSPAPGQDPRRGTGTSAAR
jgi:hypothetical protein